MSSARDLRAQRLFADYDANHRTVGNRATHYVGIPLIVFAALGLLARIQAPQVAGLRIDLGQVLWAFAAIFYIYLVTGVGLLFSLLLGVAYLVARVVPVPPLWVAFVVGWVLQFWGHSHFENKRPAFFNNVTHLMVGPVWIFSKAIGKNLKTAKPPTLT